MVNLGRNFSTPALSALISSLQCLPGVGPRMAEKMALDILRNKRFEALRLSRSIENALARVVHCKLCQSWSEDADCCPICSQRDRDNKLCIVEAPSDVWAIHQTGVYEGYYFVLMGRLSPLDGVGPKEIGIDLLEDRLQVEDFEELIIATSNTVEGETTSQYILERVGKLGNRPKITCLARGVPSGGEIGFSDPKTILLAIENRTELIPE